MTTSELITFGLTQKVTEENINKLKEILSRNEFKQTTEGALAFLQEEKVLETLTVDCRMFWGKVALSL